ncbi:DUF4870 domain-containing protein [Tenacibaculum jejuense]|uniref:Import component protein n=1 Tax=Tenacibaculum jejuense TaxID=584609 RepID=A0A238UB96_9FLAO|nr:hypothetical protein [Tenacibaculum jejuense]SNR16441.1 conserved membrane protein of unknown function [Tenacibaculum jejuense]
MKNLTTIEQGKTNAIISYITIIGTIIAFILNSSKKNSFTSFHIRQMIGLNLLSLINSWVIYRFFGGIASWTISALLAVLWFIGLMGAINGEEKKVPVFGDYFQDWFKSL